METNLKTQCVYLRAGKCVAKCDGMCPKIRFELMVNEECLNVLIPNAYHNSSDILIDRLKKWLLEEDMKNNHFDEEYVVWIPRGMVLIKKLLYEFPELRNNDGELLMNENNIIDESNHLKCNCCGEGMYFHGMCQVHGCQNSAEVEGWYESRDFAGCPTGYMRLIKVCSDHKNVFVRKGEIDVAG
jgi:hypothetical protein